MSTETVQQQNISLELIKSQFSLELSKENYSKLLQQAEAISFTKDNIEGNYEPLKKLRSVLKTVDNVHAKGKAEALAVCQMWDAAKRDIKKPIEDVLARKTAEYTKIANEIAEEKFQQQKEIFRVSGIKSTIENTVLNFAQKIAACQTNKELVDVERLINFEKNSAQSKSKYQEFLPDAVEKLDSLSVAVKKQKDLVKQLTKLEAVINEESIELVEKKEELQNRFEESKLTIQEAAINSSTNGGIEVAQEVLPQIKPRRSVWTYEVKDLSTTAKKMPSWVRMELNEGVVDEYLKAKKAEGLDDKEEFEVAGVRFFIQKTY